MPSRVLIDEYHVSLFVPRDLSVQEVGAIRRIVNGTSFQNRLLRAAELVVRAFPTLGPPTRITVSR